MTKHFISSLVSWFVLSGAILLHVQPAFASDGPRRPVTCPAHYQELEETLEVIASDYDHYNNRRVFDHYREKFGDDFVDRIKARQPGFHWIDGGGGQGHAGAFVALNYKGHQVTVVSLEELPRGYKKEREYLDGYRHLDEKPIEKRLGEELGGADLVTDVMGAFTYSGRPDLVMQKYLEALKKDGAIFIHTGERRENPSFVMQNEKPIHILDWLSHVPNLRVQILGDGSRMIRVVDHSQPVKLPELRISKIGGEGYDNSRNPPVRYFVEVGEVLDITPGKFAFVQPPGFEPKAKKKGRFSFTLPWSKE